jgi:hypothetical protein
MDMTTKQTKQTKQTMHKRITLKQAMAAMLMTGTLFSAQGAQDITAAEADQINAELAPVANPEANAQKVGSVPEDPAALVGTQFTYQGTLRLGNDRANGEYDFRFLLFSQGAGGVQLGTTASFANLTVTDGLFSTELDFGQAPIDGEDIFLQIEVRDGASSGSFTILSPRQRINATPYAVRALTGGDAGGSSSWTVSGTTIYYDGGRVGVGGNPTNGFFVVTAPVGETDLMRVRLDNSTKVKITDNGGMTIGQGSDTEVPPADGLNVFGRTTLRATNEANLTNGSGVLVIGPESGENVVIDGNEILARNNGAVAPLYLGTANGSSVDGSTGQGRLAVGSGTPWHLSMDADDIQAKDDNSVSGLRLNYFGGDVKIGASGYQTTIRGDLKQPLNQGGALKAAVYIASCGGTAGSPATVDRQYNGVSSSGITAEDNGTGKCIIDFPFDINGRFWSVSVANGPGTFGRGAMCDVSSGINNKLYCARWDTNSNSLLSGKIMVLVY